MNDQEETYILCKFHTRVNNVLPLGWVMDWGIRRKDLVLMHENDRIMSIDAAEIASAPNSSFTKVIRTQMGYGEKRGKDTPEPKPPQPHTAEELKRKVEEAEAAIKKEMTALANMHDWSNLDVEVNMTTRMHRKGKPLKSVSVRVKAEI